MPEIIILVCSVVRVRPLLYKEEQSALSAIRSSRSFDTLASRKGQRICQRICQSILDGAVTQLHSPGSFIFFYLWTS